MKISMLIQDQLLATKFYVPVAPGNLIPRPRLMTLLDLVSHANIACID